MVEAVTSNVDGYWSSGRVCRALKQVVACRIGTNMTIMAWRHIVKAIIREYSRDRRVLEVMADEYGLGMTGDDIHDK